MSSPPTDAQLNDLLEELPALAGRPRLLEELSGGLTNRNVKITTPDGVYVARCTDTASNMLGIDRDCEFHNTMAAAERWAAGIGGPAYAIDDETAIKVVDGTVEVVSEGHWRLFAPEKRPEKQESM